MLIILLQQFFWFLLCFFIFAFFFVYYFFIHHHGLFRSCCTTDSHTPFRSSKFIFLALLALSIVSLETLEMLWESSVVFAYLADNWFIMNTVCFFVSMTIKTDRSVIISKKEISAYYYFIIFLSLYYYYHQPKK